MNDSKQLRQRPRYSATPVHKLFYLQCDLSEHSVRAILSQKDHKNEEYVVAYAGRALTDTEVFSYSISEKELLAIIFGLSHFKHQTYGFKIHVVTDAQCFRFLYPIPAPKNRSGPRTVYLSCWDFEIIYRKRTHDGSVDAIYQILFKQLMTEAKASAIRPDSPVYVSITELTCDTERFIHCQRQDPQSPTYINILKIETYLMMI